MRVFYGRSDRALYEDPRYAVERRGADVRVRIDYARAGARGSLVLHRQGDWIRPVSHQFADKTTGGVSPSSIRRHRYVQPDTLDIEHRRPARDDAAQPLDPDALAEEPAFGGFVAARQRVEFPLVPAGPVEPQVTDAAGLRLRRERHLDRER